MQVEGQEQEEEEEVEELTLEEKRELAEEFLDLMKQRFINGKDADFFNYGRVDNNPEVCVDVFACCAEVT
jgi:hypothetical protein